ncbi:IclR family transcriptional regulator domain-containing protein [Streptosporangium vulgare]|uniref:IclR family transcriptional regulator domain-containing protein n=1 Tax=Streptosporangium vulgare TaxID=46190 RepID=UPI0031DB70CE
MQPLLREGALPTLRRLAEEVGATAHLTVAEGDDGLAVAVVEPSWTNMHVAYREGSRHPLERGAAGLAILALREGRTGYLVSEGQLQEGARGVRRPRARPPPGWRRRWAWSPSPRSTRTSWAPGSPPPPRSCPAR